MVKIIIDIFGWLIFEWRAIKVHVVVNPSVNDYIYDRSVVRKRVVNGRLSLKNTKISIFSRFDSGAS